jgi:hypothetical protein
MTTITAAAHCQRCDWTASGTMADVDRAADKHTRTTRHPTATIGEPSPERTTP